MDYQVAVRLDTSLHIKVVAGNTVGRKGSEMQGKDLETPSVSTVRCPTRIPHYTTRTHMQKSYVRPIQAP